MSSATILVIDDEKDLIELVRYNLEKEGFAVLAAGDGAGGMAIATREVPDLVVLDLMMPEMDGLEICRRLRADTKTARIPIIMLTAKATEADRVVGLELGADDYVIKPFSPRELTARIKAILRRTARRDEPGEVIRRGGIVIDSGRHEVSCNGKPLQLTATEFRVLQLLASRAGRVISRDDIIDGAIGHDSDVFERTVDVHIRAIRRKLGPCGSQIETVRGFGYKFRDRQEEVDVAR